MIDFKRNVAYSLCIIRKIIYKYIIINICIYYNKYIYIHNVKHLSSEIFTLNLFLQPTVFYIFQIYYFQT